MPGAQSSCFTGQTLGPDEVATAKQKPWYGNAEAAPIREKYVISNEQYTRFKGQALKAYEIATVRGWIKHEKLQDFSCLIGLLSHKKPIDPYPH